MTGASKSFRKFSYNIIFCKDKDLKVAEFTIDLNTIMSQELAMVCFLREVPTKSVFIIVDDLYNIKSFSLRLLQEMQVKQQHQSQIHQLLLQMSIADLIRDFPQHAEAVLAGARLSGARAQASHAI